MIGRWFVLLLLGLCQCLSSCEVSAIEDEMNDVGEDACSVRAEIERLVDEQVREYLEEPMSSESEGLVMSLERTAEHAKSISIQALRVDEADKGVLASRVAIYSRQLAGYIRELNRCQDDECSEEELERYVSHVRLMVRERDRWGNVCESYVE